jgi:ABC-type Fe3+/spermidine/putrescine transport system ATPase subunit
MAKSVVVEHLVKAFGEYQAVDGVSLVAEAGTITTLLGPSGCGKTTTLRCVAGLETPSSGTIRFGGQIVFCSDQRRDIPTEQRGIGMMFQNYALWPHMSVAENVAFGLTLRRLPRAEVERRVRLALDLVQLSHRAHVLPGQMSGGQQQRVALARALAYDPEVLLLDEPLANLDARLREEMRYELVEVQARTGLTALYVTHDQSEAMTLSTRIIVMHNGRIAQQGAPPEIYENPRNRFVAEFVGASNFIDVESAEPSGDRVVGRTDLGPLRARPTGGATVRYFMIRPEDVQVSLEAALGLDNEVLATIASRIYQGETIILLARARNGQILRAHVRRDHPAKPGDIAVLHLPAQCLIALEG